MRTHKRPAAVLAVLTIACVTLLTGCGEVGLSGNCFDNGNGTYSYSWFLENTVAGQSEDIIVSNVGLSPVSTAPPGPASWVGWTVEYPSAVGAFNTETFKSQTLVVQTYPVGDPSAATVNAVTATCP